MKHIISELIAGVHCSGFNLKQSTKLDLKLQNIQAFLLFIAVFRSWNKLLCSTNCAYILAYGKYYNEKKKLNPIPLVIDLFVLKYSAFSWLKHGPFLTSMVIVTWLTGTWWRHGFMPLKKFIMHVCVQWSKQGLTASNV
jgi:hypothetical protein